MNAPDMESESGMERSAGAPPAVAGTSRSRFGRVMIHDRERLPQLQRTIRYFAQNPEKANLKERKWAWMWGQDAPTTAAGTAALRS